MIIWRCDNCGAEKRGGKIVGSEFDYAEYGFGTLSIVIDGKRDLCRSCMKAVNDAYGQAATVADGLAAITKISAMNAALTNARSAA